jgi:predicted nucleotidyltransferase
METQHKSPFSYVIPESIRKAIRKRLKQIEKQHRVAVLYACESGSRAWGFPSSDSDYDVRFIYAHPEDWYLSIDLERKRDVIGQPIENELDLSGWDIRKALQLLRKSNPALIEWLQSPIIYRKDKKALKLLNDLLPVYYSEKACYYHYLHMANGNFRNYLQKDEIWLKKYFYVLRPILALKWIEKRNEMPPMEFEKLLNGLIPSGELRDEIDQLLAEKRSGKELQAGPRIESISQFIEEELERLNRKTPDKKPKTNTEPLNRAFRNILAM